MKPDRTFLGAVLVSSCIIAGGLLIGARIFAVEVPFAPYIMVVLAALVVLGAFVLILSCRDRDEIRSPQR
ncbi:MULTISPECIES: hypothetical protein [unclassified Methanoculleus]|jgi:hypothetical protein|uniref:Uncharacterized protein n=1 Tax=Methanoculleus palmolei TaxID=72612 RepID=A0ABD8A790_9EURY|nr:hypothetical protein [Methanoculleus sp. UBA377]WOX55419.1 hypothetical protein R6Y95_08085 [Methanoculleus palmolei]